MRSSETRDGSPEARRRVELKKSWLSGRQSKKERSSVTLQRFQRGKADLSAEEAMKYDEEW